MKKLFSIFGLLFLLSSPAFAACEGGRGVPVDPLFKDLTHVALYVQVPADYRHAWECHGSEDACAVDTFSSNPPGVLKDELKAKYKSYPVSLHPDELTKTFATRLRAEVLSLSTPGQGCRIPELVILADDLADKFTGVPGVLTVLVKLDITAAKPRVAVLSQRFFRPDVAVSPVSAAAKEKTAAITIDGFAGSTSAAVQKFAEQLKVEAH
jgi:hypothetical protein